MTERTDRQRPTGADGDGDRQRQTDRCVRVHACVRGCVRVRAVCRSHSVCGLSFPSPLVRANAAPCSLSLSLSYTHTHTVRACDCVSARARVMFVFVSCVCVCVCVRDVCVEGGRGQRGECQGEGSWRALLKRVERCASEEARVKVKRQGRG